MKNNALDMINKETSRLLGVQSDTLKEAMKIKNLFAQYAAKNEKTIDIAELEKWIGNLENERQKLDKLEMVLAVIGTMKAGKSTTINAIVGMEILPNRETAMTTLPTLIRNVHGQTQPVLTINKVQPLQELCKDIAKKLQGMKEPALNQINLHGIADGKTLIHHLIKNGGYPFATRYEGSEAIFEFLKQLNDVMRLAKDKNIAIEPPYHDYENVEDLPVIEVEFCHLSGNESLAQGSLAILDTPGPNEFGQSEALRRVFEKQMEKASAILLVTDFTQMNTKADEEVRSELGKIEKHLSKDRLAVVVNKFDQATKNSMSKEAVKEYVASKLLAGKIEPSKIFPVSSYRAYLSNRAKTALLHNGKLPDPEQEPWVADFASLAFGPVWENELDDIAGVNARIEKLWTNSLFAEPIDKVIKEAHATAAIKSLDSALTKLSFYNDEVTNVLKLRSSSMGKDIKKIDEMRKSLQSDIKECEKVGQMTQKVTDDCLKQLQQRMGEIMESQQKITGETIKQYFNEGKEIEKSQIKEMLENELKMPKPLGGLFNFLGIDKNPNQEQRKDNIREEVEQRFDPNSPKIKFFIRSEAEQLISDISKDIATLFNGADEILNQAANQNIQEATQTISKQINKSVGDTLKKAQEKLKNEGIKINFSLPNIDLAIEKIDSSNLFYASYQEDKDKPDPKVGEDMISELLHWINHDWGWVEQKDVPVFYVDLDIIKKKIIEQLQKQAKGVSNQTYEYLNGKFQPEIDKHLTALARYLENYHGVLGDAIKNNALDINSKTELLNHINELLKTQRVINDDLNAVKQAQETKGGQQ